MVLFITNIQSQLSSVILSETALVQTYFTKCYNISCKDKKYSLQKIIIKL